MIKVNLLKDAGKNAKKGMSNTDTSITESTNFKNKISGAMGENNALVKRLAFVIVPIVCIYIYTWMIESELKTKISGLTKQSTSLDTELANLKPEMDMIEQLKSEKNKISTEVATLKEISKKRYAYVKVLDALQSLTPEKAWITKMQYKDQTISIDGRAIEDAVISSFMQNLEESAYFSNVTWINSSEVSEPQGVVKSFSIRFTVENI